MKHVAIVWLAVLALVAGGCSQQPAESSPPAVGHIHALGVNPADATLYAGTHYGVYRFPADRDPERVGEVVQDVMGFTVVGSNHFLGSGHPGAHDTGQPASLGLIESTDGGQSWTSLSLSGEADFHALVYRHGRVYGHDSHSDDVMISSDMRTWERQSTLPAIDLAVSPREESDILATTRQGLVRSHDGAKTFSALPSAPPLALVSWPDQGPLVGVDASGTVYTSDDPATSWRAGQSLGSGPQALVATGDGVVFVATEQAIHRSIDHGASFTRYRTFG